MVKVGTKPLFWAVAVQQLVNERFKILGHFVFVVNFIVRLAEVKRIVQGGGGKFHAQFIGDLVKRHQVLTVQVLHRHAEPYIRVPHFHQLL